MGAGGPPAGLKNTLGPEPAIREGGYLAREAFAVSDRKFFRTLCARPGFMLVCDAMVGISFVMPWFERPQIAECLKKNSTFLRQPGRNLVIVTSNSLRDAVIRHLSLASVQRCRLVLLLHAPEFNKSRWLNIAVSHVETELLCLLDADIVLSEAFVAQALDTMTNGVFIRLESAEESMPRQHRQVLHRSSGLLERRHTTKCTFVNGRTASLEYFQTQTGRSLSGLLVLRRADYIRVGGSDGELKGWGFEDEDLQIRLQVEGGLCPITQGSALHLTHPEHIPSDWHETNKQNLTVALGKYSRGEYLGSYLTDISDPNLGSEVLDFNAIMTHSEPAHLRPVYAAE